ncbi:MAG: hypothetical protein JW789_02810 [Candidatus Aenigmarchaeota archaeon]|nr:hypothetical protein [Candidatus Aenigmarchaeota archaeon]
MSEGNGFLYAVAGFFFGLFLFYRGIRAFMRKRLIENIPTSKIRSIAMGMVEIFGRVEPQTAKKILRSPMSKKDCVYYKYKVEEYRSSGKSGHWVTIDKGEKGLPFHVRDDTGVVLVDPKGASVDIPKDFHFSTGFRKKEPETLLSFIKESGIKYNFGIIFKKNMRFSEHFLAPNDRCYVMGEAADNPFVEDATGKRNADDIMIRKPESGIKYYITDKGEKEILSSLNRAVLGGLILGPLLSIGCLLIIFLYTGINI